MSLEIVRSLCRDVADKYGALASEFRVLVLAVLLVLGEASWSVLKRKLEKIAETEVNPNLLAFHLRRLVRAGFVERVELDHETIYKPRLPSEVEHNIIPIVNNIENLLRKVKNHEH